MIKGNQSRTNGLLSPLIYSNPSLQAKAANNGSSGGFLRVKAEPRQTHEFLFNEHPPSSYSSSDHGLLDDNIRAFKCVVKEEPQEQDSFDNKTNLHSIIGLGSNNVNINVNVNNKQISLHTKSRVRRNSLRASYHETLQRIDPSYEHFNHYQQHWFSAGLERLKFEDKSREERLETTRYELRRQLKQILKCNVGMVVVNGKSSADEDSQVQHNDNDDLSNDGFLINNRNASSLNSSSSSSSYDRLVAPRNCDYADCKKQALPCTRYCTRHIMHNTEQVLFQYCTAKFSDNTQCSVPVFDLSNDLPLCPEHARKKDNYQLIQEMKPKKLRKKVKPSAMIRPQKRNKKKKKPVVVSGSGSSKSLSTPVDVASVSSPQDSNHSHILDMASEGSPMLEEEMVEHVLALQEPDLELVNVDQALAHQATHLLEESDITNVLNTIQGDEFNDFFTVNRNGDYEPTTEETEELERALAEVDNDVKSLEKLSQSQGLLDSLLDEHTLVESLVQIPEMFHNGYAPCGENMVVGQTSRLLPVEPHSHS